MGQVFVYLFASMVFITVLIYGYRAVGKFSDQQDQVAMIELKTKIRSTIHSIASSTTLERVSIQMPSSARQVCFVDLRKNPMDASDFTPIGIPGICDSTHPDYNAMICSSWADGVPKNVFLVPSVNLQINVGDITLLQENTVGGFDDKGYLCLDVVKQVIYLELEGKGDSTSIKRWIP